MVLPFRNIYANLQNADVSATLQIKYYLNISRLFWKLAFFLMLQIR